jgi:hypothetical protein
MRTGLILSLVTAATLQSADLQLQPETRRSWDDYIQRVITSTHQRGCGQKPFLRVAENPDRMARVLVGETVVWHAGEKNPHPVPSGLIHDWEGAALIPNARLDDVMSVLRNYSRFKEVYKPGVLDARPLKQADGTDRFSVVLRNGSYFTKTALEGEYESSSVRVDETRAYSVTCAIRLQEIENYRQPGEHKLPPDEGHGYIWRICGITQLEERDGGVIVDEEVIALSREAPTALRWVAGPIIRRVARESLAESLQKTREAVESRPAMITNRRPGAPHGE